ncbi:Yad_anchor domain-containing protein [Serratia phage vB_SspM_LC53]|nr:Yad_anchor domain-containing protein [Serratia phage vB_SspM_LC53]
MMKRIIAVVTLVMSASSFAALPPIDFDAASKDNSYRAGALNTNAQVTKAREYAAAGVAGVAAMTNIPVVPGHQLSGGVAFGGFDGEQALAAGINFVPNDAPAAFKASVAATSEEAVFGVGMGFGF